METNLNPDQKKISEYNTYWRNKYENDLILFAQDVLEYDLLTEELHGRIFKETQKHKSFLLLIPRDHYKSTLMTISCTIWDLVRNPEDRIYIANAVLGLAEKFLREIKNHLVKNKLLKDLWPEIFYDNPEKESPKWTESEILIKRKGKYKEASVTVGSVGKIETGSHFTKHIYDDIVNDENCATPNLIVKTYDWYRQSLNMLHPKGQKIIIGTRYDHSDMYGILIESGMPNLVLKAMMDGKPILPERYDEECLKEKKRDLGSYIYSCQFENDPVDQDTAIFRKSNAKYYSSVNVPMNVYILVDLAFGAKEKACETGIMVAGYTNISEIYVLEDASGFMTTIEFIDKLYHLHNKWNEPRVGVERMQAEQMLKFMLDEEAKKRGKIINYDKLKPDADKERRIRRLQPYWENGDIYLKREMRHLEDQFIKFPRYNMRDRIDALAYIVQMAIRPGVEKQKTEKHKDYGNIYEKLEGKMYRTKSTQEMSVAQSRVSSLLGW